MWELAKEIVEAQDYTKMLPIGQHPEPGEYVVTGIQAGNFRGEQGWHRYIGYVVQVRKEAGAFGTDLVLLRHPDGVLMSHENQSFHRMDALWLAKVKALFPDGLTPEEYEDYSEPYTLRGGSPEIGKIIAAKDTGSPVGGSPMVQITIQHADGSRTLGSRLGQLRGIDHGNTDWRPGGRNIES